MITPPFLPLSELEKYKHLARLGKGSFGVVTKVQQVDNGKIFAMKEVICSEMERTKEHDVRKEVVIMSNMKHDHIVDLFAAIDDTANKRLYIILEYCDSGDLGSLISKAKKQNNPLPEPRIWSYFAQLVIALNYLHEPESRAGKACSVRQVIHRDLKPDNILISEGYLKIGDFGLSKDLERAITTHTALIGTPLYMAPEVFKNITAYGTKADIWSLGCVMYELCALRSPFATCQTEGELLYRIQKGKLDSLPPQYSDSLKTVIRKMLSIIPDHRPSSKEIMKLENIDFHIKVLGLQKDLVLSDKECGRLRRERNEARLREAELVAAARQEADQKADMERVHRDWEDNARGREAAIVETQKAFQAREDAVKTREIAIADSQVKLRAEWEQFRAQQIAFMERGVIQACNMADGASAVEDRATNIAGRLFTSTQEVTTGLAPGSPKEAVNRGKKRKIEISTSGDNDVNEGDQGGRTFPSSLPAEESLVIEMAHLSPSGSEIPTTPYPATTIRLNEAMDRMGELWARHLEVENRRKEKKVARTKPSSHL